MWLIITLGEKRRRKKEEEKKKKDAPPGIEPRTFRVVGLKL